MAAPNRPPKAMSSRLATMKFMQRASGATAAPSTPGGQPPSKRQRLSSGSFNTSPSTPKSDAQAIQEAMASEERRRTAALDREALDRGDTKWYLSFQSPQTPTTESPLRIVSAGFSALDAVYGQKEVESEDDDEDEDYGVTTAHLPGRRSFGKFNKAVEKQQNPDMSSSGSDSESERDEEGNGDEDLSDDPTGLNAIVAQCRKEAAEKARQERSAKRKAAKAESLRLAEERRKKQVKLNGLTSISGGGGTPPGKNLTCHRCGQKGHIQRECPQSAQQPRKER
ncbi:Hypothetical protein R9X50_00671800 [Acrodontium crateriforme]|uniref:CCHC-type domain-containing protein n=1 Tax=Acrodontium crateriforme TaxID=150365 RepID=A0AAQ3M9N3_9PEZI|nr:Hypothetical protein R9X50_00671800 [Acrodontium crateriforme]